MLYEVITDVVTKHNIKFEDINYLIEKVKEKLNLDETKDNPVDKFVWIDYGKAILQGIKSHPVITSYSIHYTKLYETYSINIVTIKKIHRSISNSFWIKIS